MARLLRTGAATEDLVALFTEAAERPQLLAANPGLGSRRLPSHPDVRVFPCERWLIFYRPLAAGDGIDVLRVRPASSDWLGALDLATP
jgi:plasmid stabilization system protein ParE